MPTGMPVDLRQRLAVAPALWSPDRRLTRAALRLRWTNAPILGFEQLKVGKAALKEIARRVGAAREGGRAREIRLGGQLQLFRRSPSMVVAPAAF